MNCPDCGVTPGVCHEDGCDVARCVWTGLQRLACQAFSEGNDDCGYDSWSGRWPGELECEEYGWVTTDEVTGHVIHDLNRLARECRWSVEGQRWIR